MLEFYQAWSTYEDSIALTEGLIGGMVQKICGTDQVPWGDREIDFSTPFRRADMDELIAEHSGISRDTLQDPEATEAWWREHHGAAEGTKLPSTMGKWWELMFDIYVEDHLINPTFVTGFPTEISPLSRRNDADPSRVDRFELVINGWEIANGFSELNDPVDQAGRFAAQVKARDAGDDEGMYFDSDYIDALTCGMPPTAGQGIGIDRLVMLLTNSASIRDVILFPTMRPDRGGVPDTE
jgi:lysyl-tRNA synthetase class 2